VAQTAGGLPDGGITIEYAITCDDGLSAAGGLNTATALMGRRQRRLPERRS